jgi:hypothetical protein
MMWLLRRRVALALEDRLEDAPMLGRRGEVW